MNELVSIIMPSYNTAKFISKTIESVLEQTYKNWELLIVDDCSTDNTDEIVSKYDEALPPGTVACIIVGGGNGAQGAQ